MIIENISIKNFRNILETNLSFSPTINIIFGNNAQGKTNLLESLWLFSGNKSFRTNRDADLINYDCENSEIKIYFFNEERNQSSKIMINERRKAELNGVMLDAPSKLFSKINIVLFTPNHLSLIKDGPNERRKFLDSSIAMIKPSYVELLKKYNNTIAERNKILKDSLFHSELLDILFLYEEQIARYGGKIISMRKKYVEKLEENAKKIYFGISGKKEMMNIKYNTKIDINNIYQSFKKELLNSRKEDAIKGVTSVGPHRDDLLVYIDAKPARDFASQGQQRSAVLSLKLAESEIQTEVFSQKPIILLDDVMSELDLKRQEYLFNFINGSQIFITTCEKNEANITESAKWFNVTDGKINEDI